MIAQFPSKAANKQANQRTLPMILYLNTFFLFFFPNLPQKQKTEAAEQYIEKVETYQSLKNHIQNTILNQKYVCCTLDQVAS